MNHKPVILAAAACALALLVAACGGGSSSSGTSSGTTTSTGTATVASVVSGPISAFGSVFVNGRRFSTTGSAIVNDDTPTAAAGSSDLDVGMMVHVRTGAPGNDGSSSASEIHFSALARGTVEAIDCTAGTLQVMGQSATLSAATLYRDARAATVTTRVTGCAGVAVGDFIELFGYIAATGTGTQDIATLIRELDYTQGTSRFKVEGPIGAIAGTAFTINGLTVDTAAATCTGAQLSACPALTVGRYVSATGTTAPTGTAPATFAAQAVRIQPRLIAQAAGSTVELDGVVSQFSGTVFDLGGVAVDASAIPVATLAQLADGARVQVTGTLATNGVGLAATDIVVRREAQFSVEANLEAISHTSTGDTIQVLGRTFTVDSNTRFVDMVSNVRPFNSTNYQTVLTAGGATPDHVMVRGTTDATGATALAVVRLPASTTAIVAGIAAAVTDPATQTQLTIQGVPVNLAATTSFAPSGHFTSLVDFLAQLEAAQAPNASGQSTTPVYLVASGTLSTAGTTEGIDASAGTVSFRMGGMDPRHGHNR